MKIRRKSVAVPAIKVAEDYSNLKELIDFAGVGKIEALSKHNTMPIPPDEGCKFVINTTLWGYRYLNIGDYVVFDALGRLTTVPLSEFKESFEEVED